MAYSWNIGVFQADSPGTDYAWNIGTDQTGGTTSVEASISGGLTGGGSIALGVATAANISLSGGFTGGGSIFLLGSSAWAGNYDTKQYVVAFGNNQVWYCEV